MHAFRRYLTGAMLVLSLLCGTGCRFMPHSLQSSQLGKLNRGPAPRHDPLFSVSDPIPQGPTEATDWQDPSLGE